MGRGGVAVCCGPCNRGASGSNVPKPLGRDLAHVAAGIKAFTRVLFTSRGIYHHIFVEKLNSK